jgi:hypothetical protein
MVGAVGNEGRAVGVNRNAHRVKELRRIARAVPVTRSAAARQRAHLALRADGAYAMVSRISDKEGAVGSECHAVSARDKPEA